MIGIYKITSPSGRVYIGQSRDIEKRFKQYYRNGCKRQIRLTRSFDKYGIESHTFEIIEECEFNEMNIRERYYQDLYDVIDIHQGMNCFLVRTEEKPYVMTEESRLKRSAVHKGKVVSQETKDKMSKAHKGKVHSPEALAKQRRVGEAHFCYGKKMSDEQKLKISISNKGRIKSPEECAAITERLKGNKFNLNRVLSNNRFILNLETGIYYENVISAANAHNYKLKTLYNWLTGHRYNNTNLIFV